MDLLLRSLTFVLTAFLAFRLLRLHKKYERLVIKNSDLIDEIEHLKSLPVPKKEVLSVEAQQILHDMTAHGQAVVRIMPISPADVFWRSPR